MSEALVVLGFRKLLREVSHTIAETDGFVISPSVLDLSRQL